MLACRNPSNRVPICLGDTLKLCAYTPAYTNTPFLFILPEKGACSQFIYLCVCRADKYTPMNQTGLLYSCQFLLEPLQPR